MTSQQPNQLQRFEYAVDDQDIIQWVSVEWLKFARENDGFELKPDTVVGHLLWDFITGQEARHYYGLLFDKIRRERCSISMPFRCDGPECRRYMQLIMHPGEGGSLEFQSELVREEPRPSVALFDLCHPRNNDFVTMCAWCKRVRVGPDQWLEVEAALEQMNLNETTRLPNISHGLCGDCRDSLENLINN